MIDKKPVKSLSSAINAYNQLGQSFASINSLTSFEIHDNNNNNAFSSHHKGFSFGKKKKMPSKIIKLPLQFVSNARPVDVITGKFLITSLIKSLLIIIQPQNLYQLATDDFMRNAAKLITFQTLKC